MRAARMDGRRAIDPRGLKDAWATAERADCPVGRYCIVVSEPDDDDDPRFSIETLYDIGGPEDHDFEPRVLDSRSVPRGR